MMFCFLCSNHITQIPITQRFPVHINRKNEFCFFITHHADPVKRNHQYDRLFLKLKPTLPVLFRYLGDPSVSISTG